MSRNFRVVLSGLLVAILMAVALYFAIVSEKDRGFVVAECGAVHWDHFPTPLFLVPSAAEWIDVITDAALQWNHEVDAEIFALPIVLDSEFVPNGIGVVVTVANLDTESTAHLQYDERCFLGQVDLPMPALADRRLWRQFALHELGHGQGLNHDDHEASAMYPKITNASIQAVTPADRTLLRNLARAAR